MAEEKKESNKEELKKEAKDTQAPPEEASKASPEAPAEEKKDQAPKTAEEKPKAEEKPSPEAPAEEKKEEDAKKKKINRLTLKELEKKLQEVQEKMGGLHSSYAQQLLKRKEQLLPKKDVGKEEDGGSNADAEESFE